MKSNISNIDWQVINKQALSQLLSDNPQAKESNGKWYGIKCPKCGDNSAYIDANDPYSLICNHANKCIAASNPIPLKELYPQFYPSKNNSKNNVLKGNFSKEKNHDVIQYVQSRELDPSKLTFWQAKKTIKETGLTFQAVAITIAPKNEATGDKGLTFFRLIPYHDADGNLVEPNPKTSFSGKINGRIYQKQSTLEGVNEIWICEGIFNAESLQQGLNKPAIATLSSKLLPSSFYLTHKEKTFICAFDNDKAGLEATKKHIKFFKENQINYQVALPENAKDWNDLLKEKNLSNEYLEQSLQRGKEFETSLEKLTIQAKSPRDYFIASYDIDGIAPLIFEFQGSTYKGFIKEVKTKFGVEIEYYTKRLIDTTIKMNQRMIDDSVDKQHQTNYICFVNNYKQVLFTAKELSVSNEFRIALKTKAQKTFFGDCDTNDLTLLITFLEKRDQPISATQAQHYGYDYRKGCYVFPHFAYDKNGEFIQLNEQGFFDKINLFPLNEGSKDSPQPFVQKIEHSDIKKIFLDMYNAYGIASIYSFGFRIATIFAEIIYKEFGFFPFCELFGTASGGKSTLTRAQNAMFFSTIEGEPINRNSTAKGYARQMTKFRSYPFAFIEGNNKVLTHSKFDPNDLLPQYNWQNLYSTAVKSTGNETKDYPFRTGLIFVQNDSPFKTEAAKTRVVSIHIKGARETLQAKTRDAFNRFDSYTHNQLASVGDFILRNRTFFETNIIQKINEVSNDLIKQLNEQDITHDRVAKNHAIVEASGLLFCELAGLNEYIEELPQFSYKLAVSKVKTAKTELILADAFFEHLEMLKNYNDGDVSFDSDFMLQKAGIKETENEVYIHLHSAIAAIKKYLGVALFNDLETLYSQLKAHERFISSQKSQRFAKSKLTCWAFKSSHNDAQDED